MATPTRPRDSRRPLRPLPTVYVADETQSPPNSSAGIRHRNRSATPPNATPPNATSPNATPPQVHASLEEGGARRRDSFDSTNNSIQADITDYSGLFNSFNDSGFHATPHDTAFDTPYGKKPLRMEKMKANLDESFIEASTWDAIATPISDLKRRWKRKNALFKSDVAIEPLDFVPLVLLLVVICSGIFAVLALSNGFIKKAELDADVECLNGKYKSIEFAVRRLVEKQRAQGRLPPEMIQADDGEILGGKRAAIQYAYDVQNEAPKKKRKDLPLPVKREDELVGALRDTLRKLEEREKLRGREPEFKDPAQELKERRERLLKKLSQFGHFSSSKVRPLEPPKKLDDESEVLEGSRRFSTKLDDESAAKPEKLPVETLKQGVRKPEKLPVETLKQGVRKRSAPQPISRNLNPFRKLEDDPFTFRGGAKGSGSGFRKEEASRD